MVRRALDAAIAGFLAVVPFAASCGGGASLGEVTEEPADPALDSSADAALGGSAKVWKTAAALRACGSWAIDEDFSSGRYNAHRYSATVGAGSTLVVQLAREAGAWQPAVMVATAAGAPVYDGEDDAGEAGLVATARTDGRTGAVAALEIAASSRTALYLYVSGWTVLDADGAAKLPRDAEYTLSLVERCAAPVPGEAGWKGAYAGIDQDGAHVPRAGLANETLRRSLGVRVEPYGRVTELEGRSFVRGTISSFGGPNDTGVTSTETGAISGERLRSLNSPLRPSASVLAASPERYYYAAMRFDYAPNGREWWAGARLLVVSPATGRAVIVRPVDWGPNTGTRRLIDLSPQTLADLGLDTDAEALVSFAPRTSALGVVR